MNTPTLRQFLSSALFAAVIVLSFADWKVATAQAPAPTAPAPYSDAQFAALQALVNSASAATAALAGDGFADWQKARPGLGAALTGLNRAFAADAFNGKMKIALGAWPGLENAPDLDHARAAYLKVSDNVAQIVLAARKADPRFAKTIVYYCTMTADPANARWVQTSPPLTNPFWGAFMLDCCAEVKP